MKISDWVMVIGMPRSGTTFVGTTLACSPRTAYIHEPFAEHGLLSHDWWQQELDPTTLAPTSESTRRAIDGMLQLRGSYGNHIPKRDPLLRRLAKRIVGGRGRFSWRLAKWSFWSRRGLIKDPIGWHLAPWLTTEHGVKTIVVVKHPVSQVASFQRAGWGGAVDWIHDCEAMRQFLDPSDLELEITEGCPTSEACAMQWKCTYRVLGHLADRFGWPVVTIEQLSANPHAEFTALFDRLRWPVPTRLDSLINKRTGSGNPEEARSGKFQDLNRRSDRIFAHRVASVPPETRSRIYELTQEVAKQWYHPSTFALGSETTA